MTRDTAYARARAAGITLRRYDDDGWQLHNGAHVLAVIHRSPRGYSAHVLSWAVAPDAPAMAIDQRTGGAYMGRHGGLRSAVSAALRGAGRSAVIS